jgi:DNA-binding GntR family transcriptional regulator
MFCATVDILNAMARPRFDAPSPESVRSPRPVLRPVSRDSIQDRIYAELCDALICGRLQGGQTMQIRDLADAFQTSVMPVREALRRLVAEGALESATQRPVRVPPLSVQRLDDIYEARLLVEGHAAERAAAHASDALLAALADADAAFSAAIQANDVDAELQANQRFHFTIYEAAQSPTLMTMIRSLWLQSGPYVRVAVERHQPEKGRPRTQHHHGLMKALKRHDAAATRRELEADLTWAWSLMKENVSA